MSKLYNTVTKTEREEMKQRQHNRCVICLMSCKRGLVLDHHHGTGLVRDMLCRNCNNGLGFFFDDPVLLMRAAVYVERHRSEIDNTLKVLLKILNNKDIKLNVFDAHK